MISFTLCYLYYHKLISKANFVSPDSSGGIYAVLNFEAIKPIQFRILIPFIFKAVQSVVFLVKTIPDKALFFIITIGLCYLILFSFYFLLNEYFKSKAMNCWLASIIIYPMIWNYVIMNGQFFYMDFSILLIIILGFYCIVKEKYGWLLVVFLLGVLNHPSVGYLIIAFLLYNYNKLLKPKTVIYAAAMGIMYIGIYKFMDYIFATTAGYFVIYNLPRNLSLINVLPFHIIIRDLLFNFGGLHIFVIVFLLAGTWKKYRGPMLYVNLVIVPYVISVFINFSIEEIRNYITIIPFILILALLFLSTFENSFLKPVERLFAGKQFPDKKKIKTEYGVKVLYVSSNGGIHDYRFLKKLVEDYEVLFLHYAAGQIIDEIDKLDHLQIISKKPAFKSFPLPSELWHFNRILKEFKPDIIHSGYAWQVGILPAMRDFHPHLSMPWGSDILIEPDNSYVLKKLVKKVMRRSDHIQCDAEFVKQKIISDYDIPENKITVFPWGIDLSLFKKGDKKAAREKLNISEDKFVIIFNRHLEPVYGVNDLLEGFKIFSDGKNDTLLIMLSEGSQKISTVKFIADNKLEEKVHLIGRIVNKELPVFLNSSDVFISSSLSDGSSLSLLEAMACGLGIVVTDAPAIKEWVKESNGIVVPRKNPKEIAQALERYYINRELLKAHGEVSINIAKEKADWDKNYQKLKKIYEKLLNIT